MSRKRYTPEQIIGMPREAEVCLRQFVERIDFDGEEIRISGPKSALLSGLAETTKPGNHMVPGFDLGLLH